MTKFGDEIWLGQTCKSFIHHSNISFGERKKNKKTNLIINDNHKNYAVKIINFSKKYFRKNQLLF